MGKLLILLFSSLMQFQNPLTVLNFAEAAVKLGHEVTIFCDIDAVYNLRASKNSPGGETPEAKFAKLMENDVQVLVCLESARLRGVTGKEFIHGVKESSLAKMVELMEESDKVLTFKF